MLITKTKESFRVYGTIKSFKIIGTLYKYFNENIIYIDVSVLDDLLFGYIHYKYINGNVILNYEVSREDSNREEYKNILTQNSNLIINSILECL